MISNLKDPEKLAKDFCVQLKGKYNSMNDLAATLHVRLVKLIRERDVEHIL